MSARHSSIEPTPGAHGGRTPSVPSPVDLSTSDRDARLAALPSGVLALTLVGTDRRRLQFVRPFTRQSSGRRIPGRPHVGRHDLLGGWIVDLREVFAAPSTLWYALGLGTNALATSVHLGSFERSINEQLDGEAQGGGTAVQHDALIFPSATKGLQQAHGHLLVHRDGRVLFEARDNGSVFDELGTRTLCFPDIEEPEHRPPVNLGPGVSVPLQSGAALVPGGPAHGLVAAIGGPASRSDEPAPVLRLIWKPFSYCTPEAPRIQARSARPERSETAAVEAGSCAWQDGPLG